VLGLRSPADLSAERPFIEQGLDSLLAIQLANRLRLNLGLQDPTLVFQYPRLDLLTEHLLGTLPSAGATESNIGPSTELTPPATSPRQSRSPKIILHRPELSEAMFQFLRREFLHRDPELLVRRWFWQFHESAKRLGVPPQVWLATLGDEVIGHHGFVPAVVKVAHQTVMSGWFVDTMVASDQRQRGLGPALAATGDQAQPLGLSLGQAKQMKAIIRNLGWLQIAPLNHSVLLLRPGNVLKSRLPVGASHVASALISAANLARQARNLARFNRDDDQTFEIREVARFEDRHDQLWQRAAGDLNCAVVRDAAFLNWKWVDQPGQDFVRIELLRNGECQGVAILVLRPPAPPDKFSRAYLLDVVVPLGSPNIVRRLLQGVIERASQLGADLLDCHHHEERLSQQLKELGFRARPPQRFFWVHFPDDCDPNLRQAWLEPRNWFLTQADSDIDRPPRVESTTGSAIATSSQPE
jgi:hypothetical protein